LQKELKLQGKVGTAHRCTQRARGVREDKSVTSLKIFAKLVNKNAIKHQKGVPSPKKCSQPLYTLPPKIWQKPHGPSLKIFKPCATMALLNVIIHNVIIR
jgi:hypothetical protein